jgi:hypothetical protein
MAVKVTADGALLTEQLDGRAVRLDPGVHTFRFEAPGNAPLEQPVVVGEGEHDRPIIANLTKMVEKASPATHKAPPIGALVLIGTGVVAMGIGGTFYALGFSELGNDLSTMGCKNTGGCSRSEIDSVHTTLLVGDIALYTGVGVVGVGVVLAILHYTGDHKETQRTQFDVSPVPLGRGAVASTTIRW